MWCPCSADSFGHWRVWSDRWYKTKTASLPPPLCHFSSALRLWLLCHVCHRVKTKFWGNTTSVGNNCVFYILYIRRKENGRLQWLPLNSARLKSYFEHKHSKSWHGIWSQFIPSWKLSLIFPLSWHGACLDMAEITLNQTDTFVDPPPTTPDPSVTFSQATAC